MGSFLSAPPAPEWKSDAQYAMEAGAFCVLCGGLFDIEGCSHHVDPKDPRFQWLLDFRLLGCISDVAASQIASGDANATNESNVAGIFLSERAWFRASGSQYFQVPSQDGIGDIWFDTPTCVDNAGTLFPLHEACISISCRAIEHIQSKSLLSNPKPALAVLNQLLQIRFKDRHARPGIPDHTRNDLFGLCERSDEYGPRSVMAMSKLEWWGGEYDRFYTHPLDTINTSRFVLEALQALPCQRAQCNPTWMPSRSPSHMESLPPEVLDAICSYLPAPSVISLHRAAKTLALKIPLDNMMWRNRLCDASLHPHLWDIDAKWIAHHCQNASFRESFTTIDFDWKGVAQLLSVKRFSNARRCPGLMGVPDHLWNRCRIWCIVEEALSSGVNITDT